MAISTKRQRLTVEFIQSQMRVVFVGDIFNEDDCDDFIDKYYDEAYYIYQNRDWISEYWGVNRYYWND